MFLHCERHRTAVEFEPEPLSPPPPPDQVCPQCIAERRGEVVSPPTGTTTVEKISTDATTDDYLANVKNPEVRRILAERHERERLQRTRDETVLAGHDSVRRYELAYDRSRPGRERRAAYKALTKVKGKEAQTSTVGLSASEIARLDRIAGIVNNLPAAYEETEVNVDVG